MTRLQPLETGQDIPFIKHGSYPRRGGNRVRPLVDSRPAFRSICEAVEQAQHSVWITVTFVATDFQMPDGRDSIFDVLDRAVERGVDVRVMFWRPNPESSAYGQTFAGTSADFDLLAARGSRFLARWDRAPLAYCHHQKTWLIDAGRSSETAFVGGINPTSATVEPEHTGGGATPRYLCRDHGIARENAARWEAGDVEWQGLACSLNSATYGESLERQMT